MENEQDLKLLCKYCFNVLTYALKNDDKEQPPEFPKQFIGKSYPLFVTWTTGKEKDLRGCIGTFASEKLEINVQRYALISALKDDRFPPINIKEIPNLNCEISLLVNFEKVENPLDWEVGKHGIDITFTDKSKYEYSATFLPEVAEDQGWDQKTTLKYLVKKAGYYGKLDDIIDNIETERYQSLKTIVSYDEWKNDK